jgi:hypothetical protein
MPNAAEYRDHEREYQGARVLVLTPYEAVVTLAYAKSARDDAFEHLDQLDPEDLATTNSDLQALDGVLERVEKLVDRPRVAATSRFETTKDADGEEELYDETAWYWAGNSWERRLILQGSYGRSGELKRLTGEDGTPNGQRPTPRVEDILELWSVFRGAEEYHDGETSLEDFANWILAQGSFGDKELLSEDPAPCKVIW